MNNIDKLVDLEKKIQYKFQDFGLLEMAMRHSSYANEQFYSEFILQIM